MRLTLREALASERLEDFVRQEEARGLPLAKGLGFGARPRPPHHTAPFC
jgi:hypothetical protein